MMKYIAVVCDSMLGLFVSGGAKSCGRQIKNGVA